MPPCARRNCASAQARDKKNIYLTAFGGQGQGSEFKVSGSPFKTAGIIYNVRCDYGPRAGAMFVEADRLRKPPSGVQHE
jgi:hypothetical protein